MRRFLLLLLLVLLLAAVVGLNRLTSTWHYIVPVEAGQVAYAATFEDLVEDWDQYEGQVEAHIAEGRLRLEVDNVDSGPFSVAKPYFADFDLRVQATPVAGPEDNGYGVIFRLQDQDNQSPDDDSYYWFMVSSDGYYQIVRVLEGTAKRLSDWIPAPVVNPGVAGVTNWLRVVARGDQFQFYVNGQRVQVCVPANPEGESTYSEYQGGCVEGQMQDTLVDSAIPNGQIGVIAHSFNERGVVIEFDNLLVYGPDAE